ncbi:MAG: NAD(P)-dependent oxidoreductase [Candidatus Methanomethyliaceae archaeon]|nr:NAD(P)-dependent oxidoreductase [Candidatus Methanomethyliaceae archaeon]MDW7970586.1 NAD(P)-dependent oxidoreductase [Nitrososphaerota archaeon]
MRILITGGGGFVGSRLAKAMLQKGHEVIVLDKVKGELEGFEHKNMRMIIGGVEDEKLVKEAVTGCELVYYAAWSFSEKILDGFKIDVLGFLNFMEACCNAGVKHVIFPSSSVIYGEPTAVPISEDHPLLVEKSRAPVHAVTKLAVEKSMAIYYKERGLPFTIFRFWWGFDDDRIPGGTLRKIIDSALKGEALYVPKETSGSILYMDDLIRVFEIASLNERAFGKTYNLLSFNITWKEILEMIVELSNSKSKILEVDPSEWKGPGFLTGKWILDDNKLRKELGFVPNEKLAREAFRKALKKTIESRMASL